VAEVLARRARAERGGSDGEEEEREEGEGVVERCDKQVGGSAGRSCERVEERAA